MVLRIRHTECAKLQKFGVTTREVSYSSSELRVPRHSCYERGSNEYEYLVGETPQTNEHAINCGDVVLAFVLLSYPENNLLFCFHA